MLIVAAVRDCLLALIAGKVILGARRDGFISSAVSYFAWDPGFVFAFPAAL